MFDYNPDSVSPEEAATRLKTLDKDVTPSVNHPVTLVQKSSKDVRSGQLGQRCPADSLLLSIPALLPHLKFEVDRVADSETQWTYFYQQSILDLDVSLNFFVHQLLSGRTVESFDDRLASHPR